MRSPTRVHATKSLIKLFTDAVHGIGVTLLAACPQPGLHESRPQPRWSLMFGSGRLEVKATNAVQCRVKRATTLPGMSEEGNSCFLQASVAPQFLTFRIRHRNETPRREPRRPGAPMLTPAPGYALLSSRNVHINPWPLHKLFCSEPTLQPDSIKPSSPTMVLDAYTYVFALGTCFALLEAFNNGASTSFRVPLRAAQGTSG